MDKSNYCLIPFLLCISSHICTNVYGQEKNPDFLYTGKVDSVVLIVYDHLPKEMILKEGQEYTREIGKVILKTEDIKALNQNLSKKSSYNLNSASISHHRNIVINYYHKDSVIQAIHLSTYTATIDIKKGQTWETKTYWDKEADMEIKYTTDYLIGRVSVPLGKYFAKLLKKYYLFSRIDKDMLEGFERFY